MIDGEGCIAPMASSLLENCTNPGLLEVFLDDADEALLTVPLSLETVLRPNSTRAWVGFTSGTGESWQAVDVLSWSFESRGNATGGEEAGGIGEARVCVGKPQASEKSKNFIGDLSGTGGVTSSYSLEFPYRISRQGCRYLRVPPYLFVIQ